MSQNVNRCCYVKRNGIRCASGGRTEIVRDGGAIDTFCHSHNPHRMQANRDKHKERYYKKKADEAAALVAAAAQDVPVAAQDAPVAADLAPAQ